MAEESDAKPEIDFSRAFDGPAPIVNRFVILGTDTFLRLAFLEEEPDRGGIHFRAAVSMSVSDMRALYDTLSEIFGRSEPTEGQ